jgi:hypothetical protein
VIHNYLFIVSSHDSPELSPVADARFREVTFPGESGFRTAGQACDINIEELKSCRSLPRHNNYSIGRELK